MSYLFSFSVDFGRYAIPFSASRRVVVSTLGQWGLLGRMLLSLCAERNLYRMRRPEASTGSGDPASGRCWVAGFPHCGKVFLFRAAHLQARSSQRRVASEPGADPPAGLGCSLGGRHRAAENQQRGSRLLLRICLLIILISMLRLIILLLY